MNKKPKRAGFYVILFTVSFILIVAAIIGAVKVAFIVKCQQQLDMVKAQGEPITCEELKAKYYAPILDAENAKFAFQKAFAANKEDRFRYEFKYKCYNQSLTADELKTLRAHVASEAALYPLIAEVCRYDKARFDWDLSKGPKYVNARTSPVS